MPGRSATPAPPGVVPAGAPSELRLRATAPLPPLRTVADFVGLPTGAGSLSLESRRALVDGGAAAWVLVSVAVAAVGAGGLAGIVTWPYAVLLLVAAVGVPGGLAARRTLALVLAEQPAVTRVRPTTPATVLLRPGDHAATAATLASLAAQDYDGPLRVVAVSPGDLPSARAVVAAAAELRLPLELIPPTPPGRVDPRNAALARVVTPLVVSVATGACLHPSALRLLVARLESCPTTTVGVAGHLLIRNERSSTNAEALARGWTLELDAHERAEALLAGPLVANGACTLLRTDAIRAVNGWPPTPSNDVVVTWRCLERGWTITSEPQALAFVTAPVTAASPARARVVAGRGRRVAAREGGGATRLSPRSSRVAARLDRARPALDAVVALGWLQAVALLAFSQVWLLGASLVLVVPVSLAGLAVEARHHREVLDEAGLTLARPPRRWWAALVTLDPFRSFAGLWAQVSTGSR